MGKQEDIVVTSAQLGLVDLKPRVTVEVSVEDAQRLEIQKLNRIISDMSKEMEDRNDLMRAKLFYEQEREGHLNLLQDMVEALEETCFPLEKLSSYSELAVKRTKQTLSKRNEQ